MVFPGTNKDQVRPGHDSFTFLPPHISSFFSKEKENDAAVRRKIVNVIVDKPGPLLTNKTRRPGKEVGRWDKIMKSQRKNQISFSSCLSPSPSFPQAATSLS